MNKMIFGICAICAVTLGNCGAVMVSAPAMDEVVGTVL